MQLLYKGYIRRLSGSGMAYANFDNEVPLECTKSNLPVPDTFIRINSINEDSVNFDVFFFDKATNFVLNKKESATYQHEGNAFAFEIVFFLI